MAVALSNSAVERLKVEVATCTRLLNRENILGYSGHISVRLPDRRSLLIQVNTGERRHGLARNRIPRPRRRAPARRIATARRTSRCARARAERDRLVEYELHGALVPRIACSVRGAQDPTLATDSVWSVVLG